MNEAVKWMMAGMLLLSFHINFVGIPIFPGIVGCLVFCSGSRRLKRERDGETFEWSRKMELAGRLWLGITVLDLILAVFMKQRIGISMQAAAVLILAETACGCSTLNYYGELGRRYTKDCNKGPSSLGYLIWMTVGLAFYEYSVVLGSSGWNTAGAVCVIIGRIMLVKELAVWAPGEKIEL
ncbi:MAG: hypothetical protein LUK37_17570 [Clostridia bacterium]|nr:hypothetical protein [Clostridia bacterium]